MDTNSQEPPLSDQHSDRQEGYNKNSLHQNKPVYNGFKRFDIKKVLILLLIAGKIIFQGVEKLRVKTAEFICYLETNTAKFAKERGVDSSFLYQTVILLFIVFLPWISEAAIGQQEKAELKAFSQNTDPITQGKIAMSVNQYLPQELYADPDTVVLNRMAQNDTYTLKQQLSINAGNSGPERQAPTYELKSGETISQVANKFNIHVGTILAANNLQPTDLKNVKPGTVLNIPSSDTDTSDSWLVAINKADADAKAALAAAEAAKKAAAAKKIASARTTTNTATTTARSTSSYSSTITVIGTSYEQCVPWARANSGVQIHGYAGDIQPTQSTPQVGGVALDRFFGHASVVVGVGDGYIIVHEANYVRGKITERRVSTDAIRGYVY